MNVIALRRILCVVCGCLVVAWPGLAWGQGLGFEGFGAVTQGALSSPTGFTIYRVTSLADGGPGSLRDAISQGQRYVVFDVGGTILLTSHLVIQASYLTIDGASAPAPGITIVVPEPYTFSIEPSWRSGPVHDVIVHHLRLDGQAEGVQTNNGDLLGIDGFADEVYNVIFDHITASDSHDGIFDIIGGNVHDITISWSLIRDTISVTLIRGWDSTSAVRNISFHHNIWVDCSERMPRVVGNVQNLDLVNNVIYNWDVGEGGLGATHIVRDLNVPAPSMNIINNYYHAGPVGKLAYAIVYGRTGRRNMAPGSADDGGPPRQVPQGTVWTESSIMGPMYVFGNLLPQNNIDQWSTQDQSLLIPSSAAVTTYDADKLFELMVPYVGTQLPTEAEQALLEEIAAGTDYNAKFPTPFCGVGGLSVLMAMLTGLQLMRAGLPRRRVGNWESPFPAPGPAPSSKRTSSHATHSQPHKSCGTSASSNRLSASASRRKKP